MGDNNRLSQLVDQLRAEGPRVAQPIERGVFVEPAQVHRTFYSEAVAAKAEVATVTRNRHDIETNIGRVAPVDRDLRVAGSMPLRERREIHEGEVDGALDLVNIWPGQKYGRAVGVDADDGLAPLIGRGILEECEHAALVLFRFRVHVLPCPFGRPLRQLRSPSRIPFLSQALSQRH